jgi:hypothetical protein
MRAWRRQGNLIRRITGERRFVGYLKKTARNQHMRQVEPKFFVKQLGTITRVQCERNALREIATIGIGPAADASVLFEEFARRFSVVPTEEDYDGIPRSISQITEIGSGNDHELAFVLLNLFTWNNIEAELVQVYSNLEARPGNPELGDLDLILVYVPALDRYFDPTLRASGRLNEGGMPAWLEERPRIYYAYPSDNRGRGYYGNRPAANR